jgi:arabinose-5-phosphate isomerase
MGDLNIQKRISEILKRESEAIASVRVTAQFEKAVLALRACQGKVLTTGMGKAGHIARKFAATLCSTGTPAAYVHPGEAAHGDLGLIAPRDCIVAFSTSGKTNEVIEMLELGRHLGLATIVGITSHPDSHLRDLADVILDMGVIEEPCPLGLTPSASIAVMLAISDALALALMELKGVTKHDYGLRHHGGYLGRKARTDNV